MNKKICLLTTTQIWSNPRLVKEADALFAAGYEVSVVSIRNRSERDSFDQELMQERHWNNARIDFSKDSPRGFLRWFLSGLRKKTGLFLSRLFAKAFFAEMAVSIYHQALLKYAKISRHDLYIAHNLGALPVVVKAAKKYQAKVGFDAEDFHSVEPLSELVEQKYLPQCDYLTTSSESISEEYARKYKIKKPIAILNVFPLSLMKEREIKKESENLSLYWVSQVIGPKRGLENAIRAISRAKCNLRLYLQGYIKNEYKIKLFQLAANANLKPAELIFLEPAPFNELFATAARFDVGLVLEDENFLDKNLCLTNKLFVYLLAGLSIVATHTRGQEPIIESIGKAGWMYQQEDIDALASRLDFLAEHREFLAESKKAAFKYAKEKYNWDLEKEKFLKIIRETLK